MDEWDDYRRAQSHRYLDSIRKAGEQCAGVRALVDDARARAEGVGAMDYSKVMVSSSPTDDAMAMAVAEVIEAVREYATELADYERMRAEADRTLRLMDDETEAAVLRYRYLCGWTWERVCVQMSYTYDGMMKLRRRALSSYWRVMPHEYRDPMPPAV